MCLTLNILKARVYRCLERDLARSLQSNRMLEEQPSGLRPPKSVVFSEFGMEHRIAIPLSDSLFFIFSPQPPSPVVASPEVGALAFSI